VLAECVLVYMAPAAAHALLAWLRACVRRAPLAALVYEMFALGDAFGRVMHRNLAARGVALPGAAACPTFAALAERFTDLGFEHVGARTLKDVRATCVPVRELQRCVWAVMEGRARR
jgi:[phosphatase 2A protein]-leucine-carboxy methyltransferase